MRIAFDFQTFVMQRHGGISRYFVRLAEELAKDGEEPRIFAPLHANEYLRAIPGRLVSGFGIGGWPPKLNRLVAGYNFAVAKTGMRRWKPDVVHETYYHPRRTSSAGTPVVVTVYDMIQEVFGFEGDPAADYKREAVHRADHVICISHSTKRDLLRILNVPEEKVSVIHLAFEKLAGPAGAGAPLSSGKPYLLYVGQRSGYKNFDGLLRAVAASGDLKEHCDVVAFGGGGFSAEEQDRIAKLGFREGQVRQLGGSDAVLGALYDRALAFVYPSLYEGFGLPPLEAMAHDCPVVSSNTSSMPEVIGDAGEFFDPSSVEAMTAALENVASSSERRVRLIELGRERLKHFSWARCAAETREVYRALKG